MLPTTRRRGRRQTDNKQQRKEKMNGRGMRKWIGTAGSPGTGSRKKLSNFRKQTFIQVYKYIQHCLSKIYRSWKRKKKETEMKYGWGELKKRNAGTEDYWSRRELQKLNAREKNGSGNAKREMQKEKCKNDIRTPRMNEEKYAEYRYKRKRFLAYSWIHEDQLKAMEN